MKMRIALLILAVLTVNSACFAQQKNPPAVGPCDVPNLANPAPGYQKADIKQQPDNTADLPSVVQTVEQALKCYQVMTQSDDPMHPKGLPKLSSVEMDFKTVTGKSVGFTFSVFVFKIGASGEKDITNEIKFTYSVPGPKAQTGVHGLAKPSPPPLYEQLVRDVQAAASAALLEHEVLGIPLNKVAITIAYGIKFDGNVSINAPIQLVTIGVAGDYNKSNTQTITLTFGPDAPPPPPKK
jgi:hypothetical protein